MSATSTPPSPPPDGSTLQASKDDELDLDGNLEHSLNYIKSHGGAQGSFVMRWKHLKLEWAELGRDALWKSTAPPLPGPFLKPMTIVQSHMDRRRKAKQLRRTEAAASGKRRCKFKRRDRGRAPTPTAPCDEAALQLQLSFQQLRPQCAE